MKSNTRELAIVGALLAVAITFGGLYETWVYVHAGPPPALLDDFVLAEGNPAMPEVAFLDEAGEEVLLADFRGRHVILNLWATWCGPCVTELPALANLKASLPEERIIVVAVDLESLEPDEVATFLAEHDAAGLGVYRNPTLSLMDTLDVYGLPYTVVVDPQGRMVGSAFGDEPWDHPRVVAYFRDLAAQ